MVIVYNIEDGEILYTERDRMIPELPYGDTEEKVRILESEGKAFVGLAYEMGEEIFEYKAILDNDKNFVGLQPKRS